MKALKVLYNMDEIIYGQLSDTLVLGFDRLISTYISELQAPEQNQSRAPQPKKLATTTLAANSYPTIGFWESGSTHLPSESAIFPDVAHSRSMGK